MDITVGAVGFLHVRDVVVRFHDGPVERVVVGDLLYTGQLLTLLAWLFEFVGKRARGVRLRDAIDDETSRATTAARDDAFDGTGAQSSQPSSSPLAPSAGAFIARSRSLARQSSSNPGFDPRSDPTTQSLGSPEPASSAGRRPSRASADGSSGNFMNLNVPVLAAGLRVKLRGVGPNGSRERGNDLETRRDDDEKGFGDENEEGKRTTRAPPLAWSTWQLLKNAATFVKITVTDVAVDASDLNTASSLRSSSLAGVHTAARAVVAATTAFKGRGVTWTAMVDRVVVGAPAAPNERLCPAAAGGGDSTRGYLLDARVDISARYSARERRAVCVGVELDVGEVDLVEESGWTRRGWKTSSNFFDDGSAVSSSSSSASSSSSSSTNTVEGRLRSLPATVSCRVGRVRVRRVDRDGSDPPLVGSGSDLSVRVARATKEERVAHHRRKNRSLFPDKETIAKITARTTVEARWRSLDLRVTHEEDREDEDDRDKTRPGLNPGVEARCTCGEANLTAHFPLLDDANGGRNGSRTDPNGSIPTVPKATVRAEVRRADGCNHPELVRAVASAIRSVAGRPDDDTNTIDKPSPSVQKSGGGRRDRTRARPEWTCDATLRFIDGVRVRAHDGDRGVCGEWRARRWELSEDDAPLFGSWDGDGDEKSAPGDDDGNETVGESNRQRRRVEPSGHWRPPSRLSSRAFAWRSRPSTSSPTRARRTAVRRCDASSSRSG